MYIRVVLSEFSQIASETSFYFRCTYKHINYIHEYVYLYTFDMLSRLHNEQSCVETCSNEVILDP